MPLNSAKPRIRELDADGHRPGYRLRSQGQGDRRTFSAAEAANRLVVSVAEACAMLGVSKPTLYLRMRDGTLPSIRWGGRRLIRVDHLMAALDLGSGRAPEGHHDGDGAREAEA